MDQFLEWSVIILSTISIVVGAVGIYSVLRCVIYRLRVAIMAIQTLAILLAILDIAIHFSNLVTLDFTFLLFLVLNSSFILLVQIVALMACVPKVSTKVSPTCKRHVRVST